MIPNHFPGRNVVKTANRGDCGRRLILLTSRFVAPTLSDTVTHFPALFISRAFRYSAADLNHVHPAQGPQPIAHLSLRQYHADPRQLRRIYLRDWPGSHTSQTSVRRPASFLLHCPTLLSSLPGGTHQL